MARARARGGRRPTTAAVPTPPDQYDRARRDAHALVMWAGCGRRRRASALPWRRPVRHRGVRWSRDPSPRPAQSCSRAPTGAIARRSYASWCSLLCLLVIGWFVLLLHVAPAVILSCHSSTDHELTAVSGHDHSWRVTLLRFTPDRHPRKGKLLLLHRWLLPPIHSTFYVLILKSILYLVP